MADSRGLHVDGQVGGVMTEQEKEQEKEREIAADELVRALHKIAKLSPNYVAFLRFIAKLSFAVYGLASNGLTAEQIIEGVNHQAAGTQEMDDA
jgi:hypothetical protein